MGFIVKAVKSVVKAVVGIVSKVVGGVFGFLVGKSSKKAKSANTLNKSLEPETFRKIVFGRTAAPLDIRYWEVWGSKGNYYDEVLALASHRITAIRELYLEDKLAISAGGIVQAPYVGVLSRDYRLGNNGQTGMNVGSGTQWNSANSTFDYIAHMKLAWIPDEKKLPNGIPSRYTQVIDGCPVYDPRRDSTMGGSGSHRWNDNTTWEYSPIDSNGQPIGRNNALQALTYLLGWTVPGLNGGQSMLLWGRGVDIADINIQTFIAGANACEAAGYYTDVVLSTEDEHTSNEDKITCEGLIGRMIDPGGLWSYYANVNDTASIAVVLTDDDVISGAKFNDFRPMSDQFNQVGGKYVNPSAITLFQPYPYPLVRDATYEAQLGVKRRKTIDFQQVQDITLAQRLARLALNEAQFQAEHSATWNYKAMRAQAWSIVQYQSERFGWTKLFRVWRHDFSTDSGVSLTLKEIDASIWSAGTVTIPPAPGYGIGYDPRMKITVTGYNVSQTSVSSGGVNPTIYDAFIISWDAPPENTRRTEIRYRRTGTTYWETVAPIQRGAATSVLTGPLVRNVSYDIQIRHVSVHEVEGDWLLTVGNSGNVGNISYAGIVAAGTTANWNAVIDTGGKPENYADVTGTHIASGITGQGPGATASASDVLNNRQENSTTYIRNPVGAFYNGGAPNVSGRLKIKLPVGYSYTMMRFWVDIYEYGQGAQGGRSCSYLVGGYNYGDPGYVWYNAFAQYIGPRERARTVSFGDDGLTCCIWIGDPGDLWDYPVVVVRDFVAGYSYQAISNWDDGWQISFTPTAERITGSIVAPNSGNPVFGEAILESASGGVATLANFKTFLGIAAGIQNQGGLATANYADWNSQVAGSGKPENYATYDGIIDGRPNNYLPSYYRSAAQFRVRREFNDGYYLGLAGSTGYFGILETSVDWSDYSGGAIKQRFFVGDGQVFIRVGNSNDTAWNPWQRSYGEQYKPIFGNDLREDVFTLATIANFKTSAGISAGFAGQGALATLNQTNTGQIAVGAINAVAFSTGSDTVISGFNNYLLVDTGWITIGDTQGGGALAMFHGYFDSGTNKDAGGMLSFFMDTNDGSGEVLRTSTQYGVRATSGDVYNKMPITAAFGFASTGVLQVRLTAYGTKIIMPGASNSPNHTIRNPSISLLGMKR